MTDRQTDQPTDRWTDPVIGKLQVQKFIEYSVTSRYGCVGFYMLSSIPQFFRILLYLTIRILSFLSTYLLTFIHQLVNPSSLSLFYY